MAVIKSAVTPASVSPFSMRDIESHAKGLISQARQRAEQIVTAALAEAEQLKAQGFSQGVVEGREEGTRLGHEEGLKAGREAALAESRPQLASAVAALTKAMGEIEGSRRDLQAKGISDVVELAIAIARRVTRRLGDTDPAVAIANVADALKLVGHSSDVRIAIHPTQQKILAGAMPALKLQWPKLEHVEIVADPALAPGGCRLFTANGSVDGDLDGQINRVVLDLLPAPTEPKASR